MPYPAQTDRESIIKVARDMIEQEGVEQLSLARLASKLGIKAPSLYRHIPSKTALLQAVIVFTFQQLFQAYDVAIASSSSDPKDRLLNVFHAHRAFARANRESYVLAFTTTSSDQRADENLLEQLVLPIQEAMAAIAGKEQSLAALRGALAIAHGFVMLEIKEQFRRGGNLTEAFEASVEAYLVGWQHREH